MSPSIVELPERAGSLKFPADEVTATIELLEQCTPGQAVRLTDAADPKENTARRRAEIMKEQIGEVRADAIKPGYKLRGHVLTAGDPEVRKVSGKNYKFFPENWGALSLVPDNDADTPDTTPPDADPPAPAGNTGDNAGGNDPGATDAPDGGKKKNK